MSVLKSVLSVLLLVFFSATPAFAQSGADVIDDPGNLASFDGEVGDILQITLTGDSSGSIWGDRIYTSDSALAAAAVHAGVLAIGETAVVRVEILDGLPSYSGATRNDVTSSSYGSWNQSYRFEGTEVGNGDLPDPGNLVDWRGQNGAILRFAIEGRADGSVWGDGIYTDDSNLASAAVHAGVLAVGEQGVVRVEILPGQSSYGGSASNGVTSGTYGNWDGSYRILPAKVKG